MIITCTNCGRSFSVWVLESQYEVHAICPYCGKEIVVEVGCRHSLRGGDDGRA